MEREPQLRVKKKDRTDVVISVVLHVLVIGIVLYFVSKTEVGQDILRSIGATRDKKKTVDKPKPPAAKPIAKGALKPPPGAPPPASGARRAVDAPAAVGEGFFGQERKETKERSGGGSRSTNVQVRAAAPPPPRLPPRLFASAPPRSDIKQLFADRAKAAAATESFGTEQIARSGSSDAGAIIKNISGATVSDGKFAVIRGLSDRYVSTTLNGANLPSADPYRQSAPLDLFPAQVIDKVVVSKTFTPDQPGSATGGGIDVFTKSFPEKSFITLSLGGEYNTQASLNGRFLSYAGGGLDWAAMDDGTRALPAAINEVAPPGQRFPDAPQSSGIIDTSTYFQSLTNAAVVDRVSRELGTRQFAPRRENAPLNHSFSLASGGSTYLFARPLGYFASMNYKHDYSSYENGVVSRYQNGTELKSTYRDARSLSVVNWSGMVNLAAKPFEDHELGFTFFYNQNGTDDARIQDLGTDIYDESAIFRKFNLYYTQRNLNTFHMKGDHRFPDLGGLQFNWLVALTQTTQDEPDARFFNDGTKGGEYSTAIGGIPSPSKPTRYFRALDEANMNVKLDWTLPFRAWREEEGKFKFGLFESSSTRSFSERQFYYTTHGGYNDDPNQFLTEGNLGLLSISTNYITVGGKRVPRSLRFNWGDYVQVFDSRYNGDRDIQAGYLMLDVPTVPNVRLVGGVRYEPTDMPVHSESYLPSSLTGLKTNDTRLRRSDLLPAVGLIATVASNMNVRLGYSQTIARGSFREIAAYYSYDTIVNDFVEGNPELEMSKIFNYDARWEWFPRPGELFSVSVFYKNLKNAIERGNVKLEGDVITYFNNNAKLYGVEFEARKNLDFLGYPWSLFSVGGNLSLLQSKVKLTQRDLDAKRRYFPDISPTRPLYDQSPYILNLDVNYSNPSAGLNASLIFNMAGPRIALTKLNTEDVYDQPAPSLDLVISKRISRRASIRFAAKNLLDPRNERTYGKNSQLIYSSYTRGRAFGLSLSYEF